jgi:hypothetical protein
MRVFLRGLRIGSGSSSSSSSSSCTALPQSKFGRAHLLQPPLDHPEEQLWHSTFAIASHLALLKDVQLWQQSIVSHGTGGEEAQVHAEHPSGQAVQREDPGAAYCPRGQAVHEVWSPPAEYVFA